MSELGIVRVKAKRVIAYLEDRAKVLKPVVNNVLEIRSQTRMLGYLNSESPFDDDGWYNTKDIVKNRWLL